MVPIEGNWTAVDTSSAASNPQGFREAVKDTGEVGFVLAAAMDMVTASMPLGARV